MKKRLSHFPYNERSRPGWTPSTSLRKPLSPIRSTMKTVTYVPGTFVTLVPGPYRGRNRGGRERRGDWTCYDFYSPRSFSSHIWATRTLNRTGRRHGKKPSKRRRRKAK